MLLCFRYTEAHVSQAGISPGPEQEGIPLRHLPNEPRARYVDCSAFGKDDERLISAVFRIIEISRLWSHHITTSLPPLIRRFWLVFHRGSPTLFGLGRGPVTPPDPAMIRMDRKDLNSNRTKPPSAYREQQKLGPDHGRLGLPASGHTTLPHHPLRVQRTAGARPRPRAAETPCPWSHPITTSPPPCTENSRGSAPTTGG